MTLDVMQRNWRSSVSDWRNQVPALSRHGSILAPTGVEEFGRPGGGNRAVGTGPRLPEVWSLRAFLPEVEMTAANSGEIQV